jgi:hypothetical protein
MKRSNKLAPYLLSLPERSLRSLTAITAGLLREAGEIVIPSHFRRTKLYFSLVEQTLRFFVEQVGQVEGAYGQEGELPADFMVRRSAGNGIEWLSLAVLHVSPVWVLAGLSDLSGAGGRVLNEIAANFEKEGLLQGSGHIRTMSQLLEALERGSGHLAETVNTPPLNIDALRKEWEQLKSSVEIPPDPQAVAAQWQQLQATAAKADRSIFEVSTAVALSTLRSAKQHVADPILTHYQETLAEMEKVGFPQFLHRELQPYLSAALNNFSPDRRSTTEAFLIKAKRRIL